MVFQIKFFLKIYLLVVFFAYYFQNVLALSCIPKWTNFSTSFVCVCNNTYCDSFDRFDQTPPSVINVFRTDKLKDRFAFSKGSFEKHSTPSYNDDNDQIVEIMTETSLQTIIGFGGAMTDATGYNIKKLGPKLSRSVMESYFDDNGLRYTMIRVPIGGSDFSTRPYTYDDTTEEDFDLVHFALTSEDYEYKIPFIKMAQNLSSNQIKILGSPWSPPAWMKTNNKLYGKGTIKGKPNEKYYKSWANYLLKFLQEYRKNEIELWGLTIQNEPLDGFIENFPFNSNAMKPEQQRDFIFDTLGPLLNSSGFNKKKLKLIIVDDQRPFIYKWANAVLSYKQAKDYVSGIGFHWYIDRITSPGILEYVHKKYPEYFFLSTEACEGAFLTRKPILGDWQRGENYAYDIIKDLQYYTSGWIDWNMALNMDGGPNWANNTVDSPIIVNEKTGEYYKQPMYYVLGHFTRFLEPGSIQLSVTSKKNILDVVAFKTPKNSTVLIVLNRYKFPTPLRIIDKRYGSFHYIIKGHSLQTFVWFD